MSTFSLHLHWKKFQRGFSLSFFPPGQNVEDQGHGDEDGGAEADGADGILNGGEISHVDPVQDFPELEEKGERHADQTAAGEKFPACFSPQIDDGKNPCQQAQSDAEEIEIHAVFDHKYILQSTL